MIKDNPNLEDKDILQFTGSIIAGAFIFLTISAFVTNPEEKYYRLISQIYGVLTILIFTASAWCILSGFRKLAMGIIYSGIGVLGGAALILLFGITR